MKTSRPGRFIFFLFSFLFFFGAFALACISAAGTAFAQTEPEIRMLYSVSDPDHRMVLADERGVEIRTAAGFSMYDQWSPDGERILIQLESGNPMDSDILAIMGLDLKPWQAKGQTDPEFYFYNPRWAPDGKKILVVPMGGGIASVGADEPTLELVRAEPADFNISAVFPSPDGTKFAATGYLLPDTTNMNNDVFVMNTDFSNRVKLTTDQPRPSSISWSRDGKRIAFVDMPSAVLDNKVIVMDADGGNRKEFKEGFHHSVSWTDDGKLLTTWLDASVPKDRTSFLGIIDPATGLATVLRKGVNLGLGFAEWRPMKENA